ncbi:MAG: TolC family protein [Acidobacteria bacterium]|nr:TolC family protein [Acidobacteriota bacterium]
MPMRLVPALLLAGALQAQAPANPNLSSHLDKLIQDALSANPKLKEAQAALDAERAKVPQAGALPDPMVTLGYQNDGFSGLTYGRSSFAFGQVGVSQTFPYPGKRGLRTQIAQAGLAAADAALERTRRDLVASVKRGFVELLRLRGQRELLEKQATLWDQVILATRAKVEAGTDGTTDLLRAQLERTRLSQQVAEVEGRIIGQTSDLNRLAGREAGTPIEGSDLEALPLPALPGEPDTARLLAESPELSEARHHLLHFQQQLDLAKLDSRPDFTVGAAYMPQGSMPGMWSVSVGFSVPLWSGRKQKQAVAQARAESEGEGYRIRDLEQRLTALTHARIARLRSDLEVTKLYQDGLLATSDAAFRAALAQFAAGSGSFRQTLEALSDRSKDRSGYLDALAQAHADAIELERAAVDESSNAMKEGAP